MVLVPPAITRLHALQKTASQIFMTTFNPTNARTGNKILKQRLKGPTVSDYYVRTNITVAKFVRGFNKMRERLIANNTVDERAIKPMVNFEEEQRIKENEVRRRRGKGPPKKGQGKRATSGKKR
ncbi:mitochondral 37S ribosomal protein S27 [Saitoella coloradoensis]